MVRLCYFNGLLLIVELAWRELSDLSMSDTDISRRHYPRPWRIADSRSAWWLVPVVYIISAFAFVMDLQRDNTLAYGIVYTPLIVTAVFHKYRFGLWLLSVSAVVMVIIGAIFPRMDPDLPDMIGNRILSLLAILATTAFVHHARDVQERLADETSRAEAAERIKTDVLTNLSQEIRTPLHSLVGMLALTMVDSKPDQRVVLKRVSADGRQLLATIDNLIDLSQLESHSLQRETIDVAAVAQQAADNAGAAARDRQISVALTLVPSDKGTLAIGDGWAVRRILDNLLANAVRLTPPGGAVSLSVDRGAGRVTASVTDTGGGLPPDLEQDFHEDALPDDGRALPGSGGTGLALSSRLARLMDGRVFARREASFGTTIVLSLPAA